MRYAAAARYAELRELAGPVTLDIAPLDLAVEDHATNATLAARRSDDALDLLDDIFAVELLAAADILRLSGLQAGRSGAGASAVLAELDEVRRTVGPRAPSHLLHAAVRARLYDRLLPAADETLAR
jgi:histidine ammonia-lyase